MTQLVLYSYNLHNKTRAEKCHFTVYVCIQACMQACSIVDSLVIQMQRDIDAYTPTFTSRLNLLYSGEILVRFLIWQFGELGKECHI